MSALIVSWAGSFALLCFTLGLACAVLRLIRGPRAEDRILALDTLYINGMLILLVLGLRFEAGLYFDIALLIALFGFVGSAALSKFLLHGEVIEP
ncbi:MULTISPECIES: K+/H+ antiporter subunit F [unclassified Castellaniella]|jgi:multicomponent K+:H+ antiporter subunit F|uniref:K+/H+ antiporter subunit F n=1 Tax=unclassified Castellaniella TaxID=2617606 RepID=UPI003316274B